MSNKKVCPFCLNARSYIPTEDELLAGDILHDRNDFSSMSIGNTIPDHRFMLTTGNGKPTCIEYEVLCTISDGDRQWIRAGVYYPKFCPECGRELKEYKIDERGSNFERKI